MAVKSIATVGTAGNVSQGGGSSSFGSLTGSPDDNAALEAALEGKADVSTSSRWLTKTVNWLRFQELLFFAVADEGAFTLEYDGVESTSIPFGFDEADIQTALRTIPALANVIVYVNNVNPNSYIVVFDIEDPELLAVGVNTLEASNVPVNILTGETPNVNSMSVPFLEIGAGGKVEDILIERLAFTAGGDAGDVAFSDEAADTDGTSSTPAAPAYYIEPTDVYPADGHFTNVVGNDDGNTVSLLAVALDQGYADKFPIIARAPFTLHLWCVNPGGSTVTESKQRYHIKAVGDVEVAE